MATKDSTPTLTNAGDEKVLDSSSTSNGEVTLPVTPENEKTETVEEATEAELVYPTGLPFWLIVIGLCLAVFVLAIGKFPSPTMHSLKSS